MPFLLRLSRSFCRMTPRDSSQGHLVSTEERKRQEVLQLLHAKTKTEKEDVQALEKILHSDIPLFNKAQYLKANEPAFVEHLRQEDKIERYIPKEALHFWRIPIMVAGAGLFLFWLHQTVPQKVLLRHTTLSEHLYQKQHFHAVPLHAINYGKDPLGMILYFPPLLLGLFQASKFFNGYQLLGAMTANCLLSAGLHYYEDKVIRQEKFVRTLAGGAANTLFMLWLPLWASPAFRLYRQVPYALFPLFYLANEYLHFKTSPSEQNAVRVTHLSSMANGLLMGALLPKRLFLKV